MPTVYSVSFYPLKSFMLLLSLLTLILHITCLAIPLPYSLEANCRHPKHTFSHTSPFCQSTWKVWPSFTSYVRLESTSS